jgi:CDP-glucose 4,6-dehydratase
MENLVNQSSSFNWRERKVFVTGATGLVGSWLAKELVQQGASVVALIRDMNPQSELLRSQTIRDLTVVNGCLEDYATLERAISENEIEIVFHLAAQPLVGVACRSPFLTFESNIRGTYNLLEVCRIHSNLVNRLVIASSDKAYGESSSLPYTEDMPLQGQFPYEVSKSCADLLAHSYFSTYHLPVAIARCGNIYGGGDLNWSRLIPGTIRALLHNQAPEIRSDGSYVRDYIYIQDVIRAYMRLAENLNSPEIAGHAFNFSPEHPSSVMEIVNLIIRLLGCEHLVPRILNIARGEIHAQYLDSSLASRVLGWKPEWTLENGLEATINWYRTYFHSPGSP